MDGELRAVIAKVVGSSWWVGPLADTEHLADAIVLAIRDAGFVIGRPAGVAGVYPSQSGHIVIKVSGDE